MNDQTIAFLESEGDAWHLRNHSKMRDPSLLPWSSPKVLGCLQGLSSALEIGCGDGQLLEPLLDIGFHSLVGVDPSKTATSAGMAREARLDLRVGSADDLPIRGDEQFDFVIFGGCLCWIDRRRLLRAVAEADAALKTGGYLMVNDFQPAEPKKNAYHHLDKVFTYKMNYANIFLATNEYQAVHQERIIARKPQNSSQVEDSAADDDWFGYHLIQKVSCY